MVALCRSLSRRRRADAFKRWASRHRAEHTNGLESALFEAQRTLDARRTLVALDDAWRRRRRERLRRVLGTWRALSSAGNIAAAEALRDELDDTREQLGKVAGARRGESGRGGGGDAPRRARSVTEERDAAREELATAATRLEWAQRGGIDDVTAEHAANAATRGDARRGAGAPRRARGYDRGARRRAAQLEARSGDADERIAARRGRPTRRGPRPCRAVAAADARAEAALDEQRRHAGSSRRRAARRRGRRGRRGRRRRGGERRRGRPRSRTLRGEVERLQASSTAPARRAARRRRRRPRRLRRSPKGAHARSAAEPGDAGRVVERRRRESVRSGSSSSARRAAPTSNCARN